jgi:alkanesulfonate monooxygenase SsuD/methylene tetrahydromethanopterin reductase-like flavin-dependent oxidoreductase (luciferase family)
VGSPERVAERLREVRDAGVDGVTFSVYRAHETERIELAAEAARLAWPRQEEL